jgi:GT2 family glycosyltransferase
MTEPQVSVIVSTRGRPDQIADCVNSILVNRGAFEVIVVDQSIDDATERALAPFRADGRLRYERTPTIGLSISRNIGVSLARAPLLAFTDDDCRVADDWVQVATTLFDADREVALVFGRVDKDEESDDGHTPSFEPEQRVFQNSFPADGAAWGIGANMVFRRSVFVELGGFDPMLGAGAPFKAAEETDLTIRVLASGLKVVHADELSVMHIGQRKGADASQLVRGYGLGLGAALAKHVRLGTKQSGRLMLGCITHHTKKSITNTLRGKRPSGLGFVAGLLMGAYRSSQHHLDRVRSIYADP